MTIRTSRVIAVLFCASFAANAAEQTIVSAEDPSSLVTIIQALGFQARLDKDNVGDPMIRSSAGGVEFNITFYGCTKNKRCQSLRFASGYDLADGTTLEVLEDWNEEQRFASAYLDSEDDPWLQMDVNTAGGITTTNFEKNFELWQSMMADFEEHVGF
jgi:Putative bacterial sensory transduction regulator